MQPLAILLLPPLQAVLDAYLCLVHLTLGIMIESLFHSFGTVAFMQFGEPSQPARMLTRPPASGLPSGLHCT